MLIDHLSVCLIDRYVIIGLYTNKYINNPSSTNDYQKIRIDKGDIFLIIEYIGLRPMSVSIKFHQNRSLHMSQLFWHIITIKQNTNE